VVGSAILRDKHAIIYRAEGLFCVRVWPLLRLYEIFLPFHRNPAQGTSLRRNGNHVWKRSRNGTVKYSEMWAPEV
jgi:hypothetical protein